MTSSNKVKGFAAGVVAAVCYGTNPLGTLELYGDGFNSSSVLIYRYLLAVAMFAVYNPQNEMFSHFGTKRYNFKNETQFSRLYPTPQKFKKIDRLRRNEIHLKAVRTSS